jgi:osmotically-inducible protein OsmY
MSIKGRLFRTAVYASGAAATAYFFDPERGRGRRTQARDQLKARLRRAERQAEQRLRYAEGRAEGALHSVSAVPPDPPADDRTLADRIRSELGDRLPGDTVELTVVDGVVELRGQLPSEGAIVELIAQVRRVPHVSRVVNLLHVPGSPPPNKVEAMEASAAAGSDSSGTAVE